MEKYILTVALVASFFLHLGKTEEFEFEKNGFLAEGEFTFITSPNYPEPLPGDWAITWNLTSPRKTIMNLKCSEFDIPGISPACIDAFYFSPTSTGKKNDLVTGYCGKQNFDLNTTQNKFYAKLKSIPDSIVNPGLILYNSKRRFNCTVTALPSDLDVVDCGKNHLRNRIVGGKETQLHEWPWMVALRYHGSHKQFCGGSLISPEWVLTAAHCVINKHKIYIYVSIGEHDLYNGDDTTLTVHSNISQIILHKRYTDDETFKNDIALLKLANPVPYSHAISPVCLPILDYSMLFVNETGVSTGWGQISKYGASSTYLREVDLQILHNEDCHIIAIMNKIDELIGNSQMCANKEGKSSCHGDSGGPLVWLDGNGQYQLVGIVSYGLNSTACAATDSATVAATVYTRVTSFINWILQETNMHPLHELN